jgi:hypothetical protein
VDGGGRPLFRVVLAALLALLRLLALLPFALLRCRCGSLLPSTGFGAQTGQAGLRTW